MGTSRAWDGLVAEFLECHDNRWNAALHMITTPLGLLGVLSLVAIAHPAVAFGLAGLYAASLLGRVPLRVWIVTTLLGFGLAAVAAVAGLSWPWGVGMLVVGYGGQEVAHWITGERTFQSTYEREPGALRNLAVHSWMLLPLVIVAFARHLSVLRMFLPTLKVVYGHLDSEERHQDLRLIRDWVAAENPTPEHTTHWWFHDTPRQVEVALQRVAHDDYILELMREAHPGYEIEVVHEMNEIYVAGPEKDMTSDTVFYTAHVDGPFAVWPFCAVYRSLVAVTPNERVETCFVHPTAEAEPLGYTLTTGDFLAFDFNRELHLIRNLPEKHNEEQRCVLKVHYVAYPKGLAPYGRLLARLTGIYDQWARNLFLSTLTPSTAWEKLKANVVVSTTKLFDGVTRHVGWGNLLYVLLLGLASLATGSLLPLLVGASFVHYLLYLGVFEYRRGINFGKFKRDAMFFKAVSYTMLIGLYVATFSFDPLSLVLMGVGYGIATAATAALGVDRTWFGVELGQLPPKRVTGFPYNVLPHPMILGGIVGLLGFYVHDELRALYPWLVPVHIGFYLLHMVQEMTDTASTANRPTASDVQPGATQA